MDWDPGDLVALFALGLSGINLYLTSRANKVGKQAASASEKAVDIAHLAHIASYRPIILPVPEGRELDRPEGGLQVAHESLPTPDHIVRRFDLEWRPLMTGEYGPGLYSVAVENVGQGVAMVEGVTAHVQVGVDKPMTSFVHVSQREVDPVAPGDCRRFTLLDLDESIWGRPWLGVEIQIKYRNFDATEEFSTWIQLATGKVTGEALIRGVHITSRSPDDSGI